MIIRGQQCGVYSRTKNTLKKLRDLLKHKKRNSISDVSLLRVGRHFRFDKNKIIVGRNELENKILIANRKRYDYYFEIPDIGSPITLLQGPKNKNAIRVAAELTALYSDEKKHQVEVKFGRENLEKSVIVSILTKTEVQSLRIGTC